MALKIVKPTGLAVTVACWLWARGGRRSDTWNMAIVWCAPLFAYPIALPGRKALNARPAIARAEWANVPVHYAMMMALGAGIFPSIRLVSKWPGVALPVPRELGLVLVILTGIATFMTMVNLAFRGLGAPFAAKLSSRLATDWMFGWTRNPMLLGTLALLLTMGLWYRPVWLLLWAAVSVSPGWVFFVRVYEQRELEIRFASAYREYRGRTPFLWPRKPELTGQRH
jgi:protein-S-isoprenylcysteine O-methyltransferase Ste14